MGMFVDPNARVPVTDGSNTIYVKARMDAQTRGLYENELQRLKAKKDIAETEEIEYAYMGTAKVLLRVYNIVAWEGPDFLDGNGNLVPCTRYNIMRMDPLTPLWEMVGDRIGELNRKPESPDPNAAAPTGSTTDGEPR